MPETPVTADAIRTVHKALIAAQEALEPIKEESEELRLASYKLQECLDQIKRHGHAGRWAE